MAIAPLAPDPAEVARQGAATNDRIIHEAIVGEEVNIECSLAGVFAGLLTDQMSRGHIPECAIHRTLQRIEAGVRLALLEAGIDEDHLIELAVIDFRQPLLAAAQLD
jgi:hypothetical protein